MSRGTTGVPEGVLLESNGISRDLTSSGPKTPAAQALKGRGSHEICQDLTDRRRDHNPRVGGSSPSSATTRLPTSASRLLALRGRLLQGAGGVRDGAPFGGGARVERLLAHRPVRHLHRLDA